LERKLSIKRNITIGLVMGSQSDWDTMQLASDILKDFKISHETKIVSAHRTPERLFSYAKTAEKKGIKIIIAGAGGAAHLPGMISSISNLPVLGVPIESKFMNGLDSLLSIIQMPYGVPTATFAVGKAGAKNAALFAVSMLALSNKGLYKKLIAWKKKQTDSVQLRPS
jgi:5-(carboxyamino)imidazole ribonucleotide mutase